MRRQIGSLHSLAMLLVVGSLSGVLSACGGGSDGGPPSSSPPAIPQDVAKALDVAINADPASTAPDLLNADGSGTPVDNSMLEEMADAVRDPDRWLGRQCVRANERGGFDRYVCPLQQQRRANAHAVSHGPSARHQRLADRQLRQCGDGKRCGRVPIGGQSGGCAVHDPNDIEFTGMFNGAPGTYTCVSMCSLSTNMNGALVEVGGEWRFAPDDNEFLVPVEDSDYVHFGHWMHESEENGDPIIMVGAIAGGTAESPIIITVPAAPQTDARGASDL